MQMLVTVLVPTHICTKPSDKDNQFGQMVRLKF